ncbi:ChaN family lipoprotein [Caenimonas sp. SL110]|uniref:ChaN family lipoprotein n=1 Tax=Caenimonas sp. SL110 TaxID=1450524 RepID=UPI0006542291|nr:ChaN family lipoprotein [Caenimonas sp. SL110]
MRLLLAVIALSVAGCTALPAAHVAADVVLLGEQHDAAQHQQIARDVVASLADRGELAALALEMAEHGASTAALPPSAGEADVKAALQWNEQAWPWAAYGPVVMTAVRAGVTVIGANLPRTQMRAAMADARLDSALPEAFRAKALAALREGHCDLLPESQIAPMARVQVARDQSMARTISQALVRGKTVVLVTGGQHADPQMGVPVYLPISLHVVTQVLPPQPPARDYCAQMREQFKGARP